MNDPVSKGTISSFRQLLIIAANEAAVMQFPLATRNILEVGQKLAQ